MAKLVVETKIDSPPEVCFDLARDIGLHCQTAKRTQERAVAGVTTGLIELGQSVTFEAVHFGVRQRLTAQLTEFERPHRFVDEMTEGAFASLTHIHEFIPQQGSTLMRDTMIWKSPLGILGTLADKVFLKRYMRRFLMERNADLKRVAEGSWPKMQKCYAVRTWAGNEEVIKKNMEKCIKALGLESRFSRVRLPTKEEVVAYGLFARACSRHRHLGGWCPEHLLIDMAMNDETKEFVLQTLGVVEIVKAVEPVD